MSKEALSDPDHLERLQAEYPLGIGTPEDVAGMVHFLFSEEAKWMTGQELLVDGGRSVM